MDNRLEEIREFLKLVKFSGNPNDYLRDAYLEHVDYLLSLLPPPPSQDDLEVARGIVGHYLYTVTSSAELTNAIAASRSSARVAGEQAHCDHCSADLNGVRHVLCESDYRKFAGPRWWDSEFRPDINSDSYMAYAAGEQAATKRHVEAIGKLVRKYRLDGTAKHYLREALKAIDGGE